MDGIKNNIKLACSGDKQALVELVALRKGYFYRMAWSYLHDEHEVWDALQETIIKAFRDIASLRNPEYFYTWYTRILINTCKKSLQRSGRSVSMEEVGEDVREKAYPDESRMDMERGLQQLSPEHREVIFMHYMEDLPINEISLILGIPEGTVKSRIYYGISKLRKFVCERKVQGHEM